MNTTIHYLFDPLCGWCYGATAAISSADADYSVALELLPTGLFSSEGARPMDDDFVTYAWSNDQRIARLTGQSFTERYREFVLEDRQQLFDSGPATVALTAVSITAPTQELQALKAIQHARFVDGKDITKLQTLVTIFRELGLEDAASLIESPNTDLLKANRARTDRAQAVLREFNARGVPIFIANVGEKRWMLDTREIFSNPQSLFSQLNAA